MHALGKGELGLLIGVITSATHLSAMRALPQEQRTQHSLAWLTRFPVSKHAMHVQTGLLYFSGSQLVSVVPMKRFQIAL